MNPNYEILEQILRLDIEAGLATTEQRSAQRELKELAKKTKANEDLIAKSRTDMAFLEGELRRQYKKVDELEERKNERSAKLFAAKNDEEHRVLKREVDNIDRDIRELTRRIEDSEAKIESYKSTLKTAEADLASAIAASADERKKAEEAETKSEGKLKELDAIRQKHLDRVDDRVGQHYSRVAKLTRNPNGPIARITSSACGNCHMGLSPQLMNNIIKGKEIEFCPSCNHILLPNNQR